MTSDQHQAGGNGAGSTVEVDLVEVMRGMAARGTKQATWRWF
jgi:hypothetical protein